VLEVITRVGPQTSIRLTEGFLGTRGAADLDLTSVTDRLLGRIRTRHPGYTPLRVGTTRLRWAARVGDVEVPRVAFRLHNDTLRTVLIVVPYETELAAAQRFCEDLAVHDWLLTVVAEATERADLAGPGSAASIETIAPVLCHLAHLWMPGAHSPPALRGLWAQLGEEPDFDAAWRGCIVHLRNRLLVAAGGSSRPRMAQADSQN
jgi:hypothetical protein